MSDYINSIPTRTKALNTNKELLNKNNVVTNITTNDTTDIVTSIVTDDTTNIATNSITGVVIKNPTTQDMRIKKKEKSVLLTIRISESRKLKIDKIAKKNEATRQEIMNIAMDKIIELLS